MKKLANPLDRLKGLTNAVSRFPFTSAFLLAAAVFLAVSIQTDGNYEKQLLTCAVGAFLSSALQAAYERFSRKPTVRFVLAVCAAVLTLGYYLIIRNAPENTEELIIRTMVALFALFFAFLWVPVIKSRVTFNESFMAAFKAFFHSLLYAAVLFGGCSLIVSAVDRLIVSVSSKTYPHMANIIFVLFAPLFFLSLIPVYPGEKDAGLNWEETAARDERVNKATFCPKFLEVLLSYIVIPLTAVFTVILVLYIALNIRGEFWTNNLLEPLLLSYAVTVILVCILTAGIENKFAGLFRLVFPKVLIPIVLFQIAASVLNLRNTGITHGRYYVILFGVFAACAGVVMSVMPVRKYGLIAALLIAFSAVSVIPPVDAFTVSRLSQENRLEAVLIRNGMLQNNAVTPNGAVSDEDKSIIASSAEYLARMGYAGRVEWLPENFDVYRDFYTTFGFYQYDVPQTTGKWIGVSIDSSQPVDITGYDLLTRAEITNQQADAKICDLEHLGASYTLRRERAGNTSDLVLTGDGNREVIRFHADDIFSRYQGFAEEKSMLSPEEATFSAENDNAKLTVIVQNASMQTSYTDFRDSYYADAYVLIRFK